MTQNLRLLFCLGRQRTLSATRCQTKIRTLARNRITFAGGCLIHNAPVGLSRGPLCLLLNAQSPNGPSSSMQHHLVQLPGRRSTSSIDQPPDGILASSPPLRARVEPSPSSVGDGTAETEGDKGVYDSSSKQRVPKWCDRILFKSTVKPDPEPGEDTHAAPQRTP
jgi:hypothetical protein